MNRALEGQCTVNNLVFYDNSNITAHDLYDGIHLSNEGTCKLANNMLSGLEEYFESEL